MQVIILAAGLGTRLGLAIPKSMIKIKGKPFLSYQIELLRRSDLRDIVICIGYKGDLIKDHFGDGKQFGVNIRYSYEREDELLGTGQTLRKARDLLDKHFFILYGDSYADINYKSVQQAFLESGLLAMMVVYKNTDKFDKSNVIYKDGRVIFYSKRGTYPYKDYIDYGVTAFSKELLERIPVSISELYSYDLADVYSLLAVSDNLGGYEVNKRFFEIGSIEGLKDFRRFIDDSNSNTIPYMSGGWGY